MGNAVVGARGVERRNGAAGESFPDKLKLGLQRVLNAAFAMRMAHSWEAQLQLVRKRIITSGIFPLGFQGSLSSSKADQGAPILECGGRAERRHRFGEAPTPSSHL